MTDKKQQDWAVHFSQLTNRAGPVTGLNLTVPRYNPRPAGVIRPGSATQVVLALLQANPGRWFSHFQIVQATGRTQKSIDWALLFLKARHQIRTSSDEGRNSRYLKYSIVKGSPCGSISEQLLPW